MRLFHHRTPGDAIAEAKAAEAKAEARYAAACKAGAPLEVRGALTRLANRALEARRTLEYHGRVESGLDEQPDEWAGL